MTLSDSRHSLTMILPALNEEANIRQALERVITALEQHVASFEVLVINDGSTDRTGEIAEEFARTDTRVRVLHNEHNVNYGVSLARGIATARGEWITPQRRRPAAGSRRHRTLRRGLPQGRRHRRDPARTAPRTPPGAS